MKTIACLGTSHTYGVCKGTFADNKLPMEQSYTSILANRLNANVINYGRSGVSNIQLIEMTEHLCTYDRPDLIIAEMRWTVHPLMLEKHMKAQENNGLFTRTRNNDVAPDKYSGYYQEIHYGYSRDKNLNRLGDKLSGILPKNMETEFYRDVAGWVKIEFRHNIFRDQYKRQALSNMFHLAHVCKTYDVPLKIFVWAASNYSDVSESNFNFMDLPTFSFFPKTFIEYAQELKGKEWVEKQHCECEHYQLPIQELLVDTILDEVCDALR
jgi:hypothetical protein